MTILGGELRLEIRGQYLGSVTLETIILPAGAVTERVYRFDPSWNTYDRVRGSGSHQVHYWGWYRVKGSIQTVAIEFDETETWQSS
ncbi:MAG: hypothetical protein ACTSPB_21085 [Candidatus Thorarchaeota archaeon]